jgi:triacylglycerol lipase
MLRECVTVKSAVLTILVVAVIVALLVAAVIVVARRQKTVSVVEDVAPLEGVETRDAKTERGPPLPVVLVHGLFGFDRIGVPGVRFDYFRGIAKHLETLGCHVHAVRLPPYASVPARAKQLAAAIEALPHERVDVIAHSLGGLDARYALAHLGLAKRVRSLVTIGTPHRGSPIADLVLQGPIGWGHKLLRAIGMPIEAVEWLSTEALARFNQEVPDAPGVRYTCVVGGMHTKRPRVPLPLMAAHAYLKRVGGVNDGLVCVSSQYWGEVLAEIEADHFAQVGWKVSVRTTFDALGLYAFIVARLGDAQCELPAELAKEAG